MDSETIFEIIRFAVPAAWSDWAVDRVVRRIIEYPDPEAPPPRMPRGLSLDERRRHHGLAPRPPREYLAKSDGLCRPA